MPVYFFLLYLQTPIESFRASDNRLTDASYAGTVGPLIVLFGLAPRFIQHDNKWLHQNSSVYWMFNMQPLSLSACQFLLAHSIFPSQVPHDRLWATRRDVPWIRCSVALLIVASAGTRAFNLAYTGATLDFLTFTQDEVYLTLGSSLWLGLVWDDLLKAGMVHSASWIKALILCLTALVCLGPGGMAATGWLLREELLIHRRHESAVTRSR